MTKLGRPILKWAGGKARLAPEVLQRLPEKCNTYYEPFVGGGAVFFALCAQRPFKRAVLCDINAELINLYRVVQEEVELLIDGLKDLRYDEETYYTMRSAHDPATPLMRALRTVYLNKTCFNGLYRVNRSGRFNVPFGKYKNPLICDADNLRAAHEFLQGVELCVEDFAIAMRRPKRGDAVYFDPPYLPVSATSNFASYQKLPFGIREHEQLRDVFVNLRDRGVHVVLSSSDCEVSRKLYENLPDVKVDRVETTRAINSKKSGRGPVGELLVTGGAPP